MAVGISFNATDPKSPTGLDKATVTGADTCVSIGAGAAGVELTHLVAHDCETAGMAVAAGGAVAVDQRHAGRQRHRRRRGGQRDDQEQPGLRQPDRVGGGGSGSLASSYDDLFGNQTDRQGVAVGTGDLAAAVAFANPTAHDYRLTGPQPSTDKGDPADAVGDEPAPNGSRINLGAFGGTADAERSTPAGVTSDPTGSPLPTSTPAPAGPATWATRRAAVRSAGAPTRDRCPRWLCCWAPCC